MLLPRLSPIPSLIFSGSVFVASSLPDSSLFLFSQSVVPRSFRVLAASFPVLPYFFPAPPLYFHGPSPFLPGPSPILLVPFLFSPAWRPRRPPAASVFPCFHRLLPCFVTALPCFLIALLALCSSLLLTWSLPVLLLVIRFSGPFPALLVPSLFALVSSLLFTVPSLFFPASWLVCFFPVPSRSS